ncbi:MAG: hypothetical protein WC436_00415 [Candidatus Babeliales bacterium]
MNFYKIFRVFFLTFAVLNLSSYLLASTDQELFLSANSCYKQSDFEKAYDLYQQISEKNAFVNYNLGNCAYKLNKFGYALLHWRRAQKDWGIFNQQELLDNIYLLKQKLAEPTSDKLDFSSKNIFDKNNINFYRYKSILVSIFTYIPIIYLQLIFLLLWFFLFLYVRRLYRAKRKFLIVILFSLIAISGILLIVRYSLEHKHRGIVVEKKSALLSGPDKNFQQLSILPQASEFIIYKESDGYYKIKFCKQIGWIDKKEVEQI